jgi:ABC-type nitrate/sulfonate/bicarbonate transport system permease component
MASAQPNRAVRVLQAFALPLGLLLAWQIFASAGALPEFLVSPVIVGRQIGELAASGELWTHSASSLGRSFLGLAIATLFGCGFGLLAGVSRPVANFFEPLISLTYPVPKIAVLPVLMVWFGINDVSKVIVIALSCFYPCFLAAFYGVRAVNQVWVWAAQNMGARPRQIFFRVVLPAAAPHIFTGLRVALALAFMLMFSSEMIGSSNRTGLGFLILNADSGGRYDTVFAAVVTIAVLGFGSDRLLIWARRRLLPGERAVQDGEHGG